MDYMAATGTRFANVDTSSRTGSRDVQRGRRSGNFVDAGP